MINTRFMSMALVSAAILALSTMQGSAQCLRPPVSDEVIRQFKANPQGLVDPNVDTRTVEATTRDLAGTDASLATELIRVAQGTNPRFQTAIAAGLAQAAIACSTVDQQAAQVIQEAVAGFQDGQFQASFAAVAGDLSTAATEAALSSASSSVGSVVIVNPGTGSGGRLTPGGGGGTSALVTISGSGFITSNRNSPARIAAEPVSPTR